MSEVQDGQNVTFTFSEVHPDTATGSFNSSTGAVSLTDTLTLTFSVLAFSCVSTPINVALSGTWDPTSQDVTLATTSSFTIPQFPVTSNCISPIANGPDGNDGINQGVAGSTGNAMSFALNGQFAPGLPTTTALAASPSSPQLAGTNVTLTATVTDPSVAGTPDGNVNFLDNGAIISTEALSSSGTTGTATATYSTTTLPGGANQLSAAYTGSTSYAASTSTTQGYAIEPAPAITANIPSQLTPGVASPFTLTISNPASGQSYANTYVWIWQNGFLYKAKDYPTISYQDSAGNWCTLTGSKGTWYFSGAGTPPCGAPANSIPLSAGSTLSVPMEISYPSGVSGSDVFEVGLTTGSCSSATTCTAEPPFTEPVWDKGTGPGFVANVNVLPAAGPGTATATVTDYASRAATTTVRQGFDVSLAAKVTSSGSVDASPTGTVQFFVDGQSAGIEQLALGCGSSSHYCETGTLYYNTANLAPGTHTVLMNYSGDQIFAPASLTETFTVVAGPPPGTPFTCSVAGAVTSPLPFAATVTATAAGIPSTATAGTTINATDIAVTLDIDAASLTNSTTGFPTGNQPATIDFSPTGSATSGPITFTGSETSTDVVGTWSGMSTQVPVTGAPGSVVSLGVTSISFAPNALGGGVDCTPVSGPAAIGSATVSGNTLTASPSDTAPAGTAVALTDTVYPTPPSGTTAGTWGQVDFYDGTTDLATVPVAVNSTATNGTASFTTANLAVGDHQLTAIWSGNGQVGPNTSNTVDYTVGTATTTALVSSANPANAANPVAFTATVSPPQGSTTQPTGDVSFTSDGNPISGCSNQPLSMASPPTATCTTSYGAGESHSIVATYSGDATYLGSVSDPLTQTTLPGTNTTILSTKDPSPAGNVTFWSGVSPSSGTGATPTGTVAFTIDGATYKPCNAQPLGPGGGASCTVSFKAGTTHKIFATYAGSASYSGSKSSTITQTVTGSKSSTTPKDTGGSATLTSGKTLTANQSIATGSYTLVMQGDGNLVEYQGSKALWASGTSGHSGTGVVMQKDGNLVEYQGGTAIWASNTAGHEGAHLTLQGSDGNVVIYTTANQALWNTGT